MLPKSAGTAGDSRKLSVVKVGALTDTDVEPDSLSPETVGDVNVTFKLENDLPADGKIVIGGRRGPNLFGVFKRPPAGLVWDEAQMI